jgi:hypothetical protein
MSKKVYIVMDLVEQVQYCGVCITIEKNNVDGYIGFMPVFANRKKAEKFSKRRGNAEIVEGVKKEGK